jgi:hypothetical protein
MLEALGDRADKGNRTGLSAFLEDAARLVGAVTGESPPVED